jgi:hypothetical protein
VNEGQYQTHFGLFKTYLSDKWFCTRRLRNATCVGSHNHPSLSLAPLLFAVSLSLSLTLSNLLNTFTIRDGRFIPLCAVMEPRLDSGAEWLPKKLAGLLLLVMLYTPGSAHLFPASDSAKTAASVQPPGIVIMVTFGDLWHHRRFKSPGIFPARFVWLKNCAHAHTQTRM